MTKKSLHTTSLQQEPTLFRVLKYIKRNPVPIMVLGLLLLITWYLSSNYVPKDAYSASRISSESSGISYSIDTYDDYGDYLSNVSSRGINISIDQFRDYENNSKSKHDIARLETDDGAIETSNSYVIAYPKSLNFLKYEEGKTPYANNLVKKNKLKYNKILIIKTNLGRPIISFYGYSIQQKYCTIDNSKVFIVDNRLVYVYKGEFSIIDGSLF